MEYRQLGRNGLKISPMPGTMMFGGPADEATSTGSLPKRASRNQLHRYRRRLFRRQFEQVVGRAFPQRHNWVLATNSPTRWATIPIAADIAALDVAGADEA